MSLCSFPEKLTDWKLIHINEFIKLKDIEGIRFDFKSKNFNDGKGLSTHICAMANVIGGFIVLGIDDVKDKDGNLEFKKNGFSVGEEDIVKHNIFNHLSHIEPLPNIDIISIPEEDFQTFYYVIQIFLDDNKKPYFLKNKNLCYIRIGNKSEPADRLTILNLYSKFEEKRNEFFYLEKAIIQLKENFSRVIHDMDQIKAPYISELDILVPIDTKLVKDLITKVEWHLIGEPRYMLGETNIGKSQIIGLNHYIDKIEKINLYIQKFNSINDTTKKFQIIETIKDSPNFFHSTGQGTIDMLNQLTGVCTKIEQSLKY
jgi:hypothetical protein